MYRWVYHHNGRDMERLYDVGILADGTLHNPRGYPDDVVRAAVLAADERRHMRRSEAAKKAAVTRAERQRKLIYRIADRIVSGHDIGPRANCAICGKGLGDPVSIERGIGSECWQSVLSILTARKGADLFNVAEVSS
jgi:hypothetical protein